MKNKCFCKNNPVDLGESVPFLKTISDQNRLKIICFLGKGEKCVGKITDFLNIPQNLTSHHLKILSDNEIVGSRKEGLKKYYFLKKEKIEEKINFINKLIVKKYEKK